MASHLGEAANTVRRQEHRSLLKEGDRTLTGTKYLWLESLRTMGRDRRTLLSRLREACGRTGRAWALKEMASRLWGCTSKGWARKAWTA
jgi:transposase